MKKFACKILKFLRGPLLLGVLLGAFMATNLHGMDSDSKHMWKWNAVKGTLFDNADIMVEAEQSDFNYAKKAKFLNMSVAMVMLWKLFLRDWFFMPGVSMIARGPRPIQAMQMSLSFWGCIIILASSGIFDYLLGSKPLLFGQNHWTQRIITIPSNLLWHTYFKQKHKRVLFLKLMKDFLNNWDKNQKKTPPRMKELFLSLMQIYKTQGDEGLSKALPSKMQDAKTMIKDAGAWT
jgi:hypothetical protein